MRQTVDIRLWHPVGDMLAKPLDHSGVCEDVVDECVQGLEAVLWPSISLLPSAVQLHLQQVALAKLTLQLLQCADTPDWTRMIT